MTLTRPMTIDQVCRAVYGDESGYVEAVLVANPNLSERPLVLPAGTALVLPKVAPPVADRVVTLWD